MEGEGTAPYIRTGVGREGRGDGGYAPKYVSFFFFWSVCLFDCFFQNSF